MDFASPAVVNQVETFSSQEHISESVHTPSSLSNSDIVCEDDDSTCPICLELWTNYGNHRVCSLKCGHLFGSSCIEQWLAYKQHICPTCKKKAFKNQIQPIYARKLITVNATKYKNAKKELDEACKQNKDTQVELTRSSDRQCFLMQQVENLKKEVLDLYSKIEVDKAQNRKPKELYRVESLEISKDAGCRVLDCCVKHSLIVASMQYSNLLVPGFGVRKINILTLKPTTFIPLHSKSIRDLSIHPQNPWLLSVSLDKTLKIVDVKSNLLISGYTSGEVPLWACCWDLHNLNTLYVGSQQGSVSKFDLRYMTKPVSILKVPGENLPVVSLAPVGDGSIIVCKLNSLCMFKSEDDKSILLPVEGSFISMKYQKRTNHLLLSTRPNSQYSYTRHLLYKVETDSESNILCNVVHCFNGSLTQKYLSRSCFVEDISDSYVAVHDESDRRVYVWSVGNCLNISSINAHDPVLDLCGFSSRNDNFIVSLTEKKMDILKFI